MHWPKTAAVQATEMRNRTAGLLGQIHELPVGQGLSPGVGVDQVSVR